MLAGSLWAEEAAVYLSDLTGSRCQAKKNGRGSNVTEFPHAAGDLRGGQGESEDATALVFKRFKSLPIVERS